MKTAIIGLDGADWQIIEPLLDRGQLPTLHRLIDAGCRGVLRSTIPPNSGPAWASMITGVEPGKHGVFDFTMIGDDYRKVAVEPMSKLGALPLWRILNDNNIGTGIVNLPILYPPESVKGYLVCGMVTPWNARVFTFPESLSQVIGNPKEKWIIGESLARGDSPGEVLREIKDKTRRQAGLTLSLLDEFETSFLMVVFDGSDRLQHFFWKYWDSAHPRHDPQANEALRSAVSEYYIDLDTYVGRILERYGESNVFVVSDHGFGAVSQGLCIEQWLLEEGYLHLRSPIVTAPNRMVGEVVRRMWQATSRVHAIKDQAKSNKVLRRLVGRTRDAFYDRGTRLNDRIDWSKTRVFFSVFALTINLRGRQKAGIVGDGEEYANLVRELKTRLLEITDPESGDHVVRSVYHRDELYHGPRAHDAPDLVLVTEAGYRLQEGYADQLLGPLYEYGRDLSGCHRREGIFIASGPDVRKLDRQIEAAIVDILPTVLYLNHVPIPRYVDGTVIESIIHEIFQDKTSVEYTDAYELLSPRPTGYSGEERAMVEEHLRALGYLQD